ncbi:hypothetical protein F4777DRAFT_587679 [Nemania sp. FL0916]|nr:hypothetical protein F4777DRAFT_587679 [Nemania sp. FL0916]
MSFPFQHLSPLGEGTLFCAAKGCSIQTFDLSASSQPLFSWTHPSAEQARKGEQAKETQESRKEDDQTEIQPPSKRRKLGSEDVEMSTGTENGQGMVDTPATGGKRQKKATARGTRGMQFKPELPFVVLLTATEDGNHVLAVTGQDKTLWVFKHDGKGVLEEVSKRIMPKRPCSLAMTADGQTILSADKFGDVYALPLIPPQPEAEKENEQQKEEEDSAAAAATSKSAPEPSQPVSGANVFTVHSQRNRRALEDQQRQREANAKAKRSVPRKESPKFAHEVLLGHVSLLTCVVTATVQEDGRPYIITADRDEHIRVSRGMPQAHVIETYCLGHSAFVNALCVPRTRPEILVSGGGDDELFLWDWRVGKLLGTVDLAASVREILPDVVNIAVVKLVAYEVDGEVYVLAICERVPAFFVFQLEAGSTAISYKITVKLSGNALDIITLGASHGTLLVTVDVPGSNGIIVVFDRDGSLWVPREFIRGAADTDEQPHLSREDLDGALYTVENLRKINVNEEEEAGPDMPEQNDGSKPE